MRPAGTRFHSCWCLPADMRVCSESPIAAGDFKWVYILICRFRRGRTIMIKAGIIGATGYAGGELVRLLLGHRNAEIKWFGSKSYVDQKYASVYQNMFQIVEDTCLDDNMEAMAEQVDVIFTATPQGLCALIVNETVLSQTKIIDLSAFA